MKPSTSDADFIQLVETLGPLKTAERLGIALRNVHARRVRLEQVVGRQIVVPPLPNTAGTRVGAAHPGRVHIEVQNGVVLVGSDAHFWPGKPSTAWRAFLKFIKEEKPKAVIKNGDALDAASISRHPPISWEKSPTVIQEIEITQERLGEVEKCAPRGCPLIWTMGNHDARFETRLATLVPEYARVHGFHLKDHFPAWTPAWSVFINNDVAVKHRYKGGMHAPQNNTLWGGTHFVTGHLHSAKVQPITDYNGTRYGVDTGCLADCFGPQFEYAEDNPRNWRSGFGVLTFIGGKLLFPELVTVWDENHVQFRGKLIRV